ncbi:MAG: undecaprenyldiphospho-muramoylpentapeptide beta-N-acetylglucosaminyltransferase [Chloroflexota bacterium]|nr:undecaprenyldiphospho-muramoylpentapeptide beta-N-acetylglucosaminyltransferase [Chloroflexota bacterium]
MDDAQIRLVITGGGTGGHVLPALAVVEELRRREAVAELLWIGSAGGVETEAAADAGIPFRAIPTGKLRRYLSARTALDAARVPVGVVQAFRLVRRFGPSVVFSTGGFVSVPTVVAAARSVPVLTHEQTAILGLATRINARFADVLAVSYDETAHLAASLRPRVVVTGNPVRASLTEGSGDRALARFGFSPDLPLLYVTGGARGASPLNRRVAQLLPGLLDHCQVLHQTGPSSANRDAEELSAASAAWSKPARERYRVVEFVRDELADVYAAASLVLGRAGAGTVAELAFLGIPAILVPLPGAGGDEQTRNGHLLAAAGGAVLLPQTEATPERLGTTILDLLRDPVRLRAMGQAARSVGRPDAAARLADELLALARR